MNKKIILLVAVLLIVAIIFVACKGKDDVDGTTESTTESTDVNIELNPAGDEVENTIIPEIFEDEIVIGEDDIVFGDEEDVTGEDSVSWDEIVGNNS